MVKALILFSPVGLSSNYAKIESTHIEDFFQSLSFSTKSPPSELFKSLGFVSSILFDYVFISKMKNIPDEVRYFFSKQILIVIKKSKKKVKFYLIKINNPIIFYTIYVYFT